MAKARMFCMLHEGSQSSKLGVVSCYSHASVCHKFGHLVQRFKIISPTKTSSSHIIYDLHSQFVPFLVSEVPHMLYGRCPKLEKSPFSPEMVCKQGPE